MCLYEDQHFLPTRRGDNPGNHERGWNDPPMFNYNSRPSQQQQGTPKRLLNKRVAFPATNLPSPGHAVLSPSEGPPPGKPKVPDASGGIPIPKVIQAAQVGNSALPPALQVVTTSVVGQDAPLSPVLLPPSADTSMPVTVPVLVPAIVEPVKPEAGQSGEPSAEDVRLADLLSRLQLDDDSQLLGQVMENFGTVKVRYCKMLTEKACDDIHRKLEMFADKWKKGSLTEPVKVKITHLAIAMLHEETDRANHLHLALMVDHIAEVNLWMIGIKKLIQQQQLFLKEIELSSRSTVNSGPDNNPTDNITDKSVDDKSGEQNDNQENTLETAVESNCDNKEVDEENISARDAVKQTSAGGNLDSVENDTKENVGETKAVNETEKQNDNDEVNDAENTCIDNANAQNIATADGVDTNIDDQGASEDVDKDNTNCDKHGSDDGIQ